MTGRTGGAVPCRALRASTDPKTIGIQKRTTPARVLLLVPSGTARHKHFTLGREPVILALYTRSVGTPTSQNHSNADTHTSQYKLRYGTAPCQLFRNVPIRPVYNYDVNKLKRVHNKRTSEQRDIIPARATQVLRNPAAIRA